MEDLLGCGPELAPKASDLHSTILVVELDVQVLRGLKILVDVAHRDPLLFTWKCATKLRRRTIVKIASYTNSASFSRCFLNQGGHSLRKMYSNFMSHQTMGHLLPLYAGS